MAKKTTSSASKNNQGMAIAALIVNLFVPGLGSLIAGRTKEGTWQLILAIVGIILTVVIIGVPIYLAAWIWALITSISLIQQSK